MKTSCSSLDSRRLAATFMVFTNPLVRFHTDFSICVFALVNFSVANLVDSRGMTSFSLEHAVKE